MVEQAEGCLTALLDLGDYQPRANCVNRPGGDENDIVGNTVCHMTRFAMEPSSTALRNCCRVSRPLRPSATLAPGAALRTTTPPIYRSAVPSSAHTHRWDGLGWKGVRS